MSEPKQETEWKNKHRIMIIWVVQLSLAHSPDVFQSCFSAVSVILSIYCTVISSTMCMRFICTIGKHNPMLLSEFVLCFQNVV